MSKITILVLSFGLMLSCNTTTNPSKISEYFPIDSLVQAQAGYLSQFEVSLSKHAMDSLSEIRIVQLDSIEWMQELQLFTSLDINKPAYVDAYDSQIFDDRNSNLTILNYSANSDDLSVKEINIYYLRSLKDVKRITAKIGSQNILYGSSKFISMEFEQFQTVPLLRGYSIVGTKKLKFRDSVDIKIIGKVM